MSDRNAADTLRASKEHYIHEGAKGLILMNGAGAVALLALLQAIWGKPGAAAFSKFILAGTGCMLVGVALAASIFMFRHHALEKQAFDSTNPLFRRAYWYVPCSSIGAFIIGAVCVVYGGIVHLPPDKPDTEVPTKIETVPAKPPAPLKMKKPAPTL